MKKIKTEYSGGMVLDIQASREQILGFLENNTVGVLATAGVDGKPHAATVYIVHDSVLNFYFVTKKDTQKARNLAANPYAAIALYDASLQTTVQASGSVTEVKDVEQGNGIFAKIQNIARRTSESGIPPISELSAGGYVTYMLSSPSVRMATFGHTDMSSDDIFNIVP